MRLLDTIVNNWWYEVIASIAIGVDNRVCISRRMRPTNLDVMIWWGLEILIRPIGEVYELDYFDLVSENIANWWYQWIISSPIGEAFELECYHLVRSGVFELLNWWGLKLRLSFFSEEKTSQFGEADRLLVVLLVRHLN